MPDDCQRKTNNEPASPELVEELLAGLDPMPGAAPEQLSAADLAEFAIGGFASAIHAWHERDDKQREERAKAVREENARQERQRYHDEVVGRTGKPPRTYERHEHAPRQPHETEEDRSRRIKRDRQRIYRGVTAEQIEANVAARQAVTPEDHKRQKADYDAVRNADPERKKSEAERKRLARKQKNDRKTAEAQAKIAAGAIF